MSRRLRHLVGLALAALVGATLTVALPAGANGDDDDGEFRLGGTAQHARDPENSANEVIRIRTDQSPFLGRVARRLGVRVEELDHMLEFKSYFVAPKSCSAGIPRITLIVDADGDGDFQQAPASADFAAHGHIQPFAGCPPSTWKYDDLTDSLPRWEVTPGGSVPGLVGFVNPWDTFEAAVMTAFPNHQVCSGFLIDANEGSPGQVGTAYYDVISIGDETWTEFDDTKGKGAVPGCKKKDKDDDDD
jgi:hypothetical protein